jgi:hypothetical protein
MERKFLEHIKGRKMKIVDKKLVIEDDPVYCLENMVGSIFDNNWGFYRFEKIG